MSRQRHRSSRTYTPKLCLIFIQCVWWSTNGSVTSRSYRMYELYCGQIGIQSKLYWTLSYSCSFFFKRTGEKKKKKEIEGDKRKIRWIIIWKVRYRGHTFVKISNELMITFHLFILFFSPIYHRVGEVGYAIKSNLLIPSILLLPSMKENICVFFSFNFFWDLLENHKYYFWL